VETWRNPDSLAKMTDGELFYIITNGRGKMTGGEGDRTKEMTRWNPVNLVRPSRASRRRSSFHFRCGVLRQLLAFGRFFYRRRPIDLGVLRGMLGLDTL
jgi:hypothetical protein